MKMKKYLPVLAFRLSSWLSDETNREMWAEYVSSAKQNPDVNRLEVRLAWDASRLVTTADERSEWIHDCNANDATFTTLAIAAAKVTGMIS